MVMRTRGKGTNQQQALRIRGQARLYSPILGYLSYPRASPYTIPLWGSYDTENLTLLLLLPSLHIYASLWDSSAKYQLGSARGPLQYIVSITHYVKLEIPTYITQPMCIDIILTCSFVTCLLEVLLL